MLITSKGCVTVEQNQSVASQATFCHAAVDPEASSISGSASLTAMEFAFIFGIQYITSFKGRALGMRGD